MSNLNQTQNRPKWSTIATGVLAVSAGLLANNVIDNQPVHASAKHHKKSSKLVIHRETNDTKQPKFNFKALTEKHTATTKKTTSTNVKPVKLSYRSGNSTDANTTQTYQPHAKTTKVKTSYMNVINQTPTTSATATTTTKANSVPKTNTNTNPLKNLIALAKSHLGATYVYGATGENNTYDCSGFTQSLFAEIGKNIPRVAQDQYNQASPVDVNHVAAGDLVFFGADSNNISHVGIYLGNGQMIDAQDNGVVIENVYAPWWNLIGFGRY